MIHKQQTPSSGLTCLVLDILITQLQLHDALKGAEERLIEVKMRGLLPVCQHLGEDVMDEGDSLLRNVSLLMTGCLQGEKG